MRAMTCGIALLLVLAGSVASAQPAALSILEEIGMEQRVGAALPLDVALRDTQGRAVRLQAAFETRPVLIVPVYYDCPMLCTETLRGLVRAIKGQPLRVGEDFDVVVFSFDPEETPEMAAAARRETLALAGADPHAAGWRFLTGDAATVERLTRAIGFRYAYDAARDEFAHASVLVLATPDGRIARYFFGIDYAPRDLRLGLAEASDGRVGGVVEALLLYCYHYDPLTGRYGVAIMNLLRVAGLATVLLIGGFIVRHRGRGPDETARSTRSA